MKTEFFIAKRILFSKEGKRRISPPAIRIAVISMTLGIVIMILAVAIIVGFKQEVANKVIGFGSHIQIGTVQNLNSYESYPVSFTETFIDSIKKNPNVSRVESFATIPGVIKTSEDFHGIVLKGVDENYSWNFLEDNLIEGSVLRISSDSITTNVLISKNIADQMNLSLGSSFITYFIQEPIRARKYIVSGIYQTNFAEYDNLFVFADIKQVRRLNDWAADLSSGLEIIVKDYRCLDVTANELYSDLSGKQDRLGNTYYVRSVKDINPVIFQWLDVLDLNAIVILILMLVVAGSSMISSLLIIIVERANMIGQLKALGQNNTSIRKIFLLVSMFLMTKGVLWGNVIAFLICVAQKSFGIFKLDATMYYISEVPISVNFWHVSLINLGTLIVTFLILVGPSYFIAKISPAKTIRFE